MSHQVVIEGMFGIDFSKPASHMRGYLDVLLPLVRTGSVDRAGPDFTYRGAVDIHDAGPVPVVLAAMGPRMLELAGSMCDGTILTLTGPRTVAGYVLPTMAAAAERVERVTPEVMMSVPVLITTDAKGARAQASEALAFYAELPSYMAMLEREGVEQPVDLAIIGNEAHVVERVQQLSECGAAEVAIMPIPAGAAHDIEHTIATLGRTAAAA